MKSVSEWPAASVEMRPISALVPYARNSRTHSPAQVDQIVASMREWGWTNPVLVDEDGMIIAGHGRILAAQKLGMSDAPVMTARNWTPSQKQAYVIADNKLALNAGWDMDKLAVEIGDLQGAGYDIGLVGFTGDELLALAGGTQGQTDPDEVPEPEAVAATQLGDVWLLGDHRLVCGDSTDNATGELLMAGNLANILFCSPPYAQQREYGAKIANWDALMQGVFGALQMEPTGQILVNLGMVHRENEWQPYWQDWIEWMRSIGWRRFGWYVWDQGFGLPGDWNGRLAPSFEFVFHFNRTSERARKTKAKNPENIHARKSGQSTMRKSDGKTYKFSNPEASAQPNKISDSVIRITRQVGKIGPGIDHPAVFPVGFAKELIEAFSDLGDTVYEPFSGSGTTIIAGEQIGRRVFAIELNPVYVDVAIRRWQNFTGKSATLQATGQTFEEVTNARAQAAA